MQGLFTFCCLVLLLIRYLGFITEGNTYRCCATSSSPLGGNTDVVLANIIKGISSAVAGEDLQYNQVPNHKSHLLAIYIIFLLFSSPPLHKNLPFYSPLFFCSPFSREIFPCFRFLVIMASVPTPPLSPDFEVLYFKQRQGQKLRDAWYRLM